MQALPAVDPLEVAEALRDDLESLAVEDVWEAAARPATVIATLRT